MVRSIHDQRRHLSNLWCLPEYSPVWNCETFSNRYGIKDWYLRRGMSSTRAGAHFSEWRVRGKVRARKLIECTWIDCPHCHSAVKVISRAFRRQIIQFCFSYVQWVKSCPGFSRIFTSKCDYQAPCLIFLSDECKLRYLVPTALVYRTLPRKCLFASWSRRNHFSEGE
jgi:hypothetical protein